MEELIQLHFQPRLCGLCTRYWPFSPLFPSSSVLKTHIHAYKNPPETLGGLLGSHLLLAHWLPFLATTTSTFPFWQQKRDFLLLFAVPLVLCPSCVATLLHPSSCSYARFRPTTEVPYNTNTISSLILRICVWLECRRKKCQGSLGKRMNNEINTGLDHVFSIPQQVLNFDGFFTFFYEGVGDFCSLSQHSIYILQLTAAAPMSVSQLKTQCAPLLLHTEEAGLPGKLGCSIILHLYHMLRSFKNIFAGGHTNKSESSSGLGFQLYWRFWQFRTYTAANQNSQWFEDQALDWGKKLVWAYGFPVDN